MLTLSRKEGESLILTLEDGQTIEVHLDQIRGTQARISIDAPDSVKILREELLD